MHNACHVHACALTPRQQQILELIGAGKTNREISRSNLETILFQQLPQFRRGLQHNIRSKSAQLILFAKAA